jgi:hypothetical protein
MDFDQLPIQVDVKANLTADTKDAASVIKKFMEIMKVLGLRRIETREPLRQAKTDISALKHRIKALPQIASGLGLKEEEAVALVLRADQFEVYKKIRQQQNIDAIAGGTIPLLPESLSEESVDEDWIATFFEECKNIGNKQMQSLWSQILAGEIARPRSFSKRTLSVVGQLSQDEAHSFTKLCSLVWSDNSKMFIIRDWGSVSHFVETYGIEYKNLMELEGIGLLKLSADSRIELGRPDLPFLYFAESFRFTPKNSIENQIPVIPLSNVGAELAPISGAKKDETYKLATIKHLTDRGFIVEKYQKIIQGTDT